eukprot:TRINITY_DN22524_c0_g3_i2.p1 TRINITY_DN22524_c0_g3~~TRINITY_DN22524_c0_g3_i2.p1  ORF type:complete len:128 (+),score=39.80 TRINITY_DN22524_c0_g3_i2:412-795(+)
MGAENYAQWLERNCGAISEEMPELLPEVEAQLQALQSGEQPFAGAEEARRQKISEERELLMGHLKDKGRSYLARVLEHNRGFYERNFPQLLREMQDLITAEATSPRTAPPRPAGLQRGTAQRRVDMA